MDMQVHQSSMLFMDEFNSNDLEGISTRQTVVDVSAFEMYLL